MRGRQYSAPEASVGGHACSHSPCHLRLHHRVTYTCTQAYAGGFGWGVCIKGPGRVNWLIRAASVSGHELGMTQFARVVAAALSVTLGPSVAHQFHVLAPCNVIGGVHVNAHVVHAM